MSILRRHRISIAVAMVVLSGCTSVPPQVVQVQLQEKAIIESLRTSHLALVDVYMAKKFEEFENFFFTKYGPHYHDEWMKAFRKKEGRQYEFKQDFPFLYNDLVAEYQEKSKQVSLLHSELRQSIVMEYRNALDAHITVSRWLEALKNLNETQRNVTDSVLKSIRPELSLEVIENKIRGIVKDLVPSQGSK